MLGSWSFGKAVLWALALVGGVIVVRKYGPTVWAKTKQLVGKGKETLALGTGPTLVACNVEQGSPAGSVGGQQLTPIEALQSSPLYRWCYLVGASDTAGSIAKKIVGDDARYTELLVANPDAPKKGIMGVVVGPDAWDFATGALAYGGKLLVPQTWNAWIDQKGRAKGGYLPYDPDTRTVITVGEEMVESVTYPDESIVEVESNDDPMEIDQDIASATVYDAEGFDYVGAEG